MVNTKIYSLSVLSSVIRETAGNTLIATSRGCLWYLFILRTEKGVFYLPTSHHSFHPPMLQTEHSHSLHQPHCCFVLSLQMEIQVKWGLGMSRSTMMCICSANWMFCISNPCLDGLRPGGGSADLKPLFEPEIDVGGSKVFIYELLENCLQDILLVNHQINVQCLWS